MKYLGLFLFFVNSFGVLTAQTKHYVTQNGTGNGDSWSTAAGDLQAVISNAAAGDSIFVAGGTYLPIRRADKLGEKSPDDRDNAFVLKKDIKVYGGFAGSETSLAERDLSLTQHASVLSGDIGVAADPTDNVYHVVISAGDAGSAELNGFTISGAYCNASGGAIEVNENTIYHRVGGGVYNNASSPKLMNLMIQGNRNFNSGGGIYNRFGASPELINVRISGNQAGHGGGIFIEGTESPMTLTNVTISGNQGNQGGGIYIGGSPLPLVLTNVTISGNMGNAIFNFSSKIEVRNSIIYGNASEMFNNGDFSASYSLVEGYTDETNGNISEQLSPEFVDPLPEPALSIDGDYQLKGSSPAINAGNNDYYNAGSVPDLHEITTDLIGEDRIQKGRVDMGAYESPDDGALPVTLHDFTGQLQSGVVTLQWQSGVEAAFDHYDLEKSKDGKSYRHLATKIAMGSNSDYSYSGPQSEPTAYYRLKLTDNNGHSKYYQKIVSLSQDMGPAHIRVYPNPAKDYIYIKSVVAGQMSIYNAAGIQVKRQKLTNGLNKVEVTGLSSGVYYAVVNGQKVKFVKN